MKKIATEESQLEIKMVGQDCDEIQYEQGSSAILSGSDSEDHN